MKTRRIIILLLFSVASILLIIFSWMNLNTAYRINRMSTFIIGEADGPTSILVANTSYNYMLYGITVIVIIITLLLSVIYGRKRK
jgi:Na+-transporting methylmalonyl-CoA/oxaloacetate decarboxylase beta subunit